MTKKWRRFLEIVFSVVFSTLFFSPVFAEGNSTTISPDLEKTNIVQGETIKNYITLKNDSEESLELKIYSAPYIIKNENYEISFSSEEKTDSSEIVDWLSFKNEKGVYEKEIKIRLSPGEEKEISYHIDFPKEVEKEQRCFIFAETSLSEESSIRVASSLITSFEDKSPNSEVKNLYQGQSESSRISSEFSIKNSGEKFSEVSSSFSVKSLFDKTLYSDERENLVFPSLDRKFKFEWENTPNFGLYKIELNLKIDGEEQNYSKIVFLMPLFVKIIMILVLTFITFMLIIKRRNYQNKQRKV